MRVTSLTFALVLSLGASAQTTIQYDSGNTSNVLDLAATAGNLFTGLNSAVAVTQLTYFIGPTDLQPAHQFRFDESVGGANLGLQTVNPSAGMNTDAITNWNGMFTGTDLFVRINLYNGGPSLALDISGGSGVHAFYSTGSAVTAASPANFVLRITGATGLPVELLEASVE